MLNLTANEPVIINKKEIENLKEYFDDVGENAIENNPILKRRYKKFKEKESLLKSGNVQITESLEEDTISSFDYIKNFTTAMLKRFYNENDNNENDNNENDNVLKMKEFFEDFGEETIKNNPILRRRYSRFCEKNPNHKLKIEESDIRDLKQIIEEASGRGISSIGLALKSYLEENHEIFDPVKIFGAMTINEIFGLPFEKDEVLDSCNNQHEQIREVVIRLKHIENASVEKNLNFEDIVDIVGTVPLSLIILALKRLQKEENQINFNKNNKKNRK